MFSSSAILFGFFAMEGLRKNGKGTFLPLKINGKTTVDLQESAVVFLCKSGKVVKIVDFFNHKNLEAFV